MTRKNLACSVFAAALSFSAAHAATTTINAGGSSLAAPTYIAEFNLYTNGAAATATTPAVAAHKSVLFNYEAVGSGAGQKAFLGNNIGYFQPVSGTNTVGYAAGTLTSGTIVGTQVDVGASDAFLVASQLTAPATGSYANSAVDGPLIQLPTIGVPIAMAYNESLVPAAGLTLTDAKICGVLSGKITDWHTLVSTIPAGTTIHVVYRSDGSGTTFLTTQHLNAVCTSTNSSFPVLPVPITKTFVAATGGVFTSATVPANFTAESGSSGVATQAVATSGSFTYLSPDYTSIAPLSANTTALKVAKVVNGINLVAYLPTVANTTTGLANADLADSINATPPATLTAAQNPLNWVPEIPQTTLGYSIVGYTTMDVSSCYANAAAGTALINFLTLQYANAAYATIIKNNGFVPLINSKAAPFATAAEHIFLNNTSGYNLNIDNATTCASYAGR